MIQNYVSLEPTSHTYTDTDGRVYTSVSHVLNTVEEKFDGEEISKQCAGRGKYVGLNKEQVQGKWIEIREEGNRIHNCIEKYSKTFSIDEKNRDLTEMTHGIVAGYKSYVRTYEECTLYHPEYMVAGTADKILLPTTRSAYVDIDDYKSSDKDEIGMVPYGNKYKKFPVEHLGDTKYNRYCLQVSIYGVMFEYLTGKKIRNTWLTYIPQKNPSAYVKIPFPYMKTDAISILENFKKQKKIKQYPLTLHEAFDANEEPNFTI